MSSELSLNKPDVVKLILGLDNGVTKKVKEIINVCSSKVSTCNIFHAFINFILLFQNFDFLISLYF